MMTDNIGVGCPDPGRNRIIDYNIILQTNKNTTTDIHEALDTVTDELSLSAVLPTARRSITLATPEISQSPEAHSESITSTVDHSSHILLPVNRMMEVINNNLATCKICKTDKLQIIQQHSLHLAERLTIHCERCFLRHRSIKAKCIRLSKKLAKQKRLTIKDRTQARKLYDQIRNLKQNIAQYENEFNTWKIDAEQNEANKDKINNCSRSSVTYEINLRCMLAAYHLGTGPQDVTKLFSMLGLGSMLWFERTFTRHEAYLNNGIIKVANEIIDESMISEIKTTLSKEIGASDAETWIELVEAQRYDEAKAIAQQCKLTASFDVGWQKRSTGRVYDSLSGHGYMIGCSGGRVISMGVLCKKCSVCITANRKGIEPSTHSCTINHEGSSGGMEARLCVQLVEKMSSKFGGMVVLGALVTDDDSTIRSRCRNHSEGGKLSGEIPTPKFLADPGHRIKVMGKAIFKVVTKTKNPDEVRSIDALRWKKYFSCYVAQNKTKGLDVFIKNANAALEHLFNNHCFCDSSWCWAKSIDDHLHELITTKVKQNLKHESNNKETTTTHENTYSNNSMHRSDDLSYEELENHWLEALNLEKSEEEDDNGDAYSDMMSDEEYLPSDYDDIDSEDSGGDVDSVSSEDDWAVDDLNYELAISNVIDNYSMEQTVFSEAELEDIKVKEKILIERGDKGYYRDKDTHARAYTLMCEALQQYMKPEMLSMLHHSYTTQINESLNKSVSSYAPKHKTYSLTKSLEARVGVAASVQIGGYEKFWHHTYKHFDLNFHNPLATALAKMDKDKSNKRKRAATKEGKRKRSASRHKKLNDAHKQDTADFKKGFSYESGVALAAAKKTAKHKLTNAFRNPKNTTPDRMKCKFFHPLYCQKLGHKTCNNKECAMFGKTKAERDEAESKILQSYQDQLLAESTNKRK